MTNTKLSTSRHRAYRVLRPSARPRFPPVRARPRRRPWRISSHIHAVAFSRTRRDQRRCLRVTPMVLRIVAGGVMRRYGTATLRITRICTGFRLVAAGLLVCSVRITPRIVTTVTAVDNTTVRDTRASAPGAQAKRITVIITYPAPLPQGEAVVGWLVDVTNGAGIL